MDVRELHEVRREDALENGRLNNAFNLNIYYEVHRTYEKLIFRYCM